LISDLKKHPFVIFSHGIRSCKETPNTLIPAAMLWRNKFNVLLVDLRNHGESQISSLAYASFGNTEYSDILGGLDYLVATYPRLANSTKLVGLWGCSMGGAVVTIAAAQTRMINALWLEAPALSVRETLDFNVRFSGYDVPFIDNAVCNRANIVWPWGCAPFARDPIQDTKNSGGTVKNVFFSSKTDDTEVPYFNVENGAALMKQLGVNVTIYATKDDNAPVKCRHHCDVYAYDPVGYEQRIAAFFNSNLKRLP
jgi:pimeloyl-ACP methyl ester carboxylesterase